MERFAALIFVIGAVDHLTGDRLKLGPEFRAAFSAIPELLLLMTGFMTLAPWIGDVIGPALSPFFVALGCDPSLLAGMILSSDGGAAVLAEQLALSPEAGLYNGMVVGSFLGCTVVCAIPLSLSSTHGESRKAAVDGLLIAFVILPLACVFTGLLCGFSLTLILSNTWPVLLMSLLLLLLFRFCGDKIVSLFAGISFAVRAIALAGFSLSVLQEAFGVTLLPGMAPLNEVFPVICRIGVFLAGILPFIALVRRVISVPLALAGKWLDIEPEAVMSLVLSAANSIPVLTTLEKLSLRGITLNTAFLTLASFAIGDHLAFALQYAPQTAVPLMLGKLLSGLAALGIAVLAANRKRSPAQK